jgi:hypothetical protein
MIGPITEYICTKCDLLEIVVLEYNPYYCRATSKNLLNYPTTPDDCPVLQARKQVDLLKTKEGE